MRTKERILTAALRVFAERGFEGASTREIAAAAGVNAPALRYYFGGKQGVYSACLEHMRARASHVLSSVTERAEQALGRSASDAELIDVFCAIQMQTSKLLSTSCDEGQMHDWRMFMARQSAGLEPAVDLPAEYSPVCRRTFVAMASIVGRLLRRPAGDSETLIRAYALSGQMAIFQVMRATALKALNWTAIDPGRLALLKRIVDEQTRVLLRDLSGAERGDS